MFDLFWDRLKVLQEKYGVKEPSLPGKRRAPSHLEVRSSKGFHHSTPKDYYSQQYFECLDLIVNAVQERCNQPGYAVLQKLEELLLKAARNEKYYAELAFVLQHYQDDFVASSLEAQLELLATVYSSSTEKPTFEVSYFTISSTVHFYSEICTFVKLIMVSPATNAISERSASVLRRVKTYLRYYVTNTC